jgi:hypothetical protein
VPSSRQDILHDSLWNQYLLEEIPTLFLESLDAFQREQTSLPIDALHLFLQFLPRSASIYGSHLFTSMSRTIFHRLRTRRFLPVVNDNERHMPHECVLIDDAAIRTILTPELLCRHLNFYYLPDCLHVYRETLYELGVNRIGHQELLDLMKQMLTSHIEIIDIHLLGQWLSCLYRCFNELTLIDEENVLRHLRTLTILPVNHRQTWLSVNQTQQTIFFPSTHLHLSKIIEDDLLIIDEQLWNQYDEHSLVRTQIQMCLERLGIQRLTHRTICEQHIYPMVEHKNQWQDKSIEQHHAYIMYLFDLWSKQV